MRVRGITIGYLTVALVALIAALIPVPDNNRGEGMMQIAALAGIFLLALWPLRLMIARHPSPTRQLFADIRSHWREILGGTVIFFSLAVVLETGSGIKKSIPVLMPFYADPFLIRLDRSLFGTDPWRYTHALFGWATPLSVWLYNFWHSVQIGLAIWIALSFDEVQKIRFALVFQFCWLLVAGFLAVAFSSVGPVMVSDFYADTSFAPLLMQLEEAAPSVLRIKDLLIATMDDPLIISGISAMPSMHVAIAVLAALWIQRLKRTPLTIAAWSYAAAIYVSSIHLGWHYATDGLLSAPIVILFWWLAGKYVDWLDGCEFHIGAQAVNAP